MLREAPLTRDLILELYSFDIDDEKNNRERTDCEGECPAWERLVIMRKFAILVRYVREKSAPVIGQYPEFNFWIVEDENRKRRCVHIKEGLNEDYVLKNLKIMEKLEHARQHRLDLIRNYHETPPMTEEGSEMFDREKTKHMWQRSRERRVEQFVHEYCLRKHIKYQIKELKWSQTRFRTTGLEKIDKQIIAEYKPNFKGIQHFFGQNAIEMYLETFYDTGDYKCDKTEEFTKSLKKMLKEIILSDYQHRDYLRPNRNEDKIKSAQEKQEHTWLELFNEK